MAEDIMKKWYIAISERTSIRSFYGRIPKKSFYNLKNFACTLFGGVDGTNCFAAVIVRDDNNFMGGYIGGSYKKSALKNCFKLDDDEKVICVIAVGIAAEAANPVDNWFWRH